MKSSGMKRGLAVSAVTALALTGVALAPAQAQTIIQGENDTLELYSQVSGDIGVRNDGTNATVTLSAASNMAAVNSFVFTATGTGAPIEIADVAAINGYGTVQWTPPAGVTLEDIDNIRVEAENNADVNLGTVNQAIATTTVANNEVVGLDGVDGAPLGVYDGSATVTGLTTDAPNTSFQIAGPDVAALDAATVFIRRGMDTVGGFTDIQDTRAAQGLEWRMDVDRAEASRFGANVASIGQAIQLVTQGIKVGEYRPDDASDELDIRVRFPAEARTLASLDALRVQTDRGLVPIGNFVDRVAAPKVENIERTGGQRTVTVESGVASGVLVADKLAAVRVDNALLAVPVLHLRREGVGGWGG